VIDNKPHGCVTMHFRWIGIAK